MPDLTQAHALGPWCPGALALLLMAGAVAAPLLVWGGWGRGRTVSPGWLGWLTGAGSMTLLGLALAALDRLAYQHQLYVGGNGHVVVTSSTLLHERIDAEVPAGEVSRVVLRRGPSGLTLTFERAGARGERRAEVDVQPGSEEIARLLADRIGQPLVIE